MHITGRLYYFGPEHHPWGLVQENIPDPVDLAPIADGVLRELAGRRVAFDRTHDSLTLGSDRNGKFWLEYKGVGNGSVGPAILRCYRKPGYFNLRSLLDKLLIWLNARRIIVNVTSSGIHIEPDRREPVFGVHSSPFEPEHWGYIPRGAEQERCRAGTPGSCIFLAKGAQGYRCLKPCYAQASRVLAEVAWDDMARVRIGNCAVLEPKKAHRID